MAYSVGQGGKHAKGRVSQTQGQKTHFCTTQGCGTDHVVSISHLRYSTNALHVACSNDSKSRRHALPPPLGRHILDYEPPRGFVIPTFTMFDGSTSPYDHMLHYNQTMTLNAGNDLLLCNVFLASLRGPALVLIHKLPQSSINTFNELWGVFISQHLCSECQKRNISSLQTILKQEDESIRDFMRRFEQTAQQIEFYTMDVVLQNFRRSFGSLTPFFHSLSLDLPVTMEELYR